jgi:hypothetical protein
MFSRGLVGTARGAVRSEFRFDRRITVTDAAARRPYHHYLRIAPEKSRNLRDTTRRVMAKR